MSDLSTFYRNQLRLLAPVEMAFALIPKAGNTSLRHGFYHAIGGGRDFKLVNDEWRIGKGLQIGTTVPPHYHRIMVVRNPWDRLRSCYTDKVALPRGRQNGGLAGAFPSMGCWRGMPFDEFVRIVYDTSDYEIDKHAMPVHYLFNNPVWGGAPDQVLRLEDPDMWQRLRCMFEARGVSLPDRMPRENHSDRVEKPQWTPELIRLVGERYETDIKLLGYTAPRG